MKDEERLRARRVSCGFSIRAVALLIREGSRRPTVRGAVVTGFVAGIFVIKVAVGVEEGCSRLNTLQADWGPALLIRAPPAVMTDRDVAAPYVASFGDEMVLNMAWAVTFFAGGGCIGGTTLSDAGFAHYVCRTCTSKGNRFLVQHIRAKETS